MGIGERIRGFVGVHLNFNTAGSRHLTAKPGQGWGQTQIVQHGRPEKHCNIPN